MQPRSTIEMRVGELLVKLGILDEGQLEQALTVQREQTKYKPLGEICKELGFISGPALRNVLSIYRKQILLGDLLLKMGIISDNQLREALQEQKINGGKLGQILVRKRFLTPSALVDSLCIQLGIVKIHPNKDLIDRALLNRANVSFYRKKRIIPLRLNKEKRILTVIMEDPTDSETIADLQKTFSAEIEPALCSSREIDLLLNEVFDTWFDSR